MAVTPLRTYELRSPTLGYEIVVLSLVDDDDLEDVRLTTSNIKFPPPPPQGNSLNALVAFEDSVREAGWTIESCTPYSQQRLTADGHDREHPIPLVPMAKSEPVPLLREMPTAPVLAQTEKGELLHGPWKDEGGLQLSIEAGTHGQFELYYAWPGDDWCKSSAGDPLQFALVREIVRLKAEANARAYMDARVDAARKAMTSSNPSLAPESFTPELIAMNAARGVFDEMAPRWRKLPEETPEEPTLMVEFLVLTPCVDGSLAVEVAAWDSKAQTFEESGGDCPAPMRGIVAWMPLQDVAPGAGKAVTDGE